MVFILSIIFALSSAQELVPQDTYFTITRDANLSVKLQLDESITVRHFFAGTSITMLDAFINEQGQKWLRIGIESENFLEQDNFLDLWIRAEDMEVLALIEDISARMTYCYRYVKKYLLAKGFVDEYLPGVSAYMAATILPKYGFSKTNRVPTKAIKYDVCVYKGGPSGHGHIEVLDPKGWYYGYGYKKNPIANRIFIACFHKNLN
ncbi:hypothetical protein K2X05_12950 [bacterium]|nr:hypothetical protein [bacterium]